MGGAGFAEDGFRQVTRDEQVLHADYALRLALLEDASDLPAYAMLFANDERVRDDVRRENVVATVMITE